MNQVQSYKLMCLMVSGGLVAYKGYLEACKVMFFPPHNSLYFGIFHMKKILLLAI